MIGELFNLHEKIKVERKEINKDVLKYLIYKGETLEKIFILNWSDKIITTDNETISKIQLNSYYSKNLYDKADINGMLSMDRIIISEKSKIFIKPYSLSLLSFNNE